MQDFNANDLILKTLEEADNEATVSIPLLPVEEYLTPIMSPSADSEYKMVRSIFSPLSSIGNSSVTDALSWTQPKDMLLSENSTDITSSIYFPNLGSPPPFTSMSSEAETAFVFFIYLYILFKLYLFHKFVN